MEDLELMATIEFLREKVKRLEAQIDVLQKMLSEYMNNPKPIEAELRVWRDD